MIRVLSIQIYSVHLLHLVYTYYSVLPLSPFESDH